LESRTWRPGKLFSVNLVKKRGRDKHGKEIDTGKVCEVRRQGLPWIQGVEETGEMGGGSKQTGS